MDPRAGKPAERSMLVNIPRLMTAYYTRKPDASIASSGSPSAPRATAARRSTVPSTRTTSSPSPRPSASTARQKGIDGPLFLGIDTHALSEPALASALEVLAANGVDVMIDDRDGYTPTPGHLARHPHLQPRPGTSGLADGIVITPSHNPPEDGGFKYNPPNGGPADTDVTGWIEDRANELLADGLAECSASPLERARARGHHAPPRLPRAPTSTISGTSSTWTSSAARKLALGVDPLGGAGVALLGARSPSATSCRSRSCTTWSIPPSAS